VIDGTIQVTNYGPRATAVAVLVAYAQDVPVAVTCPTPLPFVVAPGATVPCRFRAALPDGRARSLISLAIPTRGAPAFGVQAFSFSAPGTTIQDFDRVVEATAPGVGHVYLTDANFEPHVVTTYHRQVGPYATCGAFTSPASAHLRALTGSGSQRSGLLAIDVNAPANVTVPCI